MKKTTLRLLFTICLAFFSLALSAAEDIFSFGCYSSNTAPFEGWNLPSGVQQTSKGDGGTGYWKISGTVAVMSKSIDVNQYKDLTLTITLATYGGSSKNNLQVEYSLDGGTSWNASNVFTPKSTTYATFTWVIGTVNSTSMIFRFKKASDAVNDIRIGKIALSGIKETKGDAGLNFATDVVAKVMTDAAFINGLTNPNNVSVEYSSNNLNVATVDPVTGEVTLKGEGTAIITAAVPATNETYMGTASYTLNVSKVDASLTYVVSLVAKYVTDNAFINALTNPNGISVVYSSGDLNVATVDPVTGEVTIKGEGSTVITAAPVDNQVYKGSANYTLTVTVPTTIVAPVVFSVVEGIYNAIQNVELSCTTPEAIIKYTLDGTDPFTSSTAMVYSNAIVVDRSMTIMAGGMKDNMDNGIVTSNIYTLKVPAIVSSLAMSPAVKFDAVQTTTLSVEGFPHAKIYFDATDKTPSITDAFLYDGTPIVIDGTTAIKAIATIDGWENSDVVRFSWTATDFKLPVPTADVPEGTYNTPQSVTLSSSVAGATVKYVIGSTWNDASAVEFTTPIEINTTTTIIAKAEKNGWTGSNQFKATYTIDNSIMKWIPSGNKPATVEPSLYTTGLQKTNLSLINFENGATDCIGGTAASGWCTSPDNFKTTNSYFTASVVPEEGYVVTISKINVAMKRNNNSSAPKNFAIQYSIGDETNYTTLYQSTDGSIGTTSALYSCDIAAPIKAAKSIYFRIIPIASGSAGAFYIAGDNGGLSFEGTVVPMETSTVTDATTIEQDVDGHLVVDGSNGTLPQISVPVEKQVAGKVTVARKFETKKNWYAVSFPFDIESVAVVHTDGTDFPLTAGTHYWLRSFEPKNISESIIFGDVASIQANKGYIIAFPQSFPDGGFTVKFTSVAGVTLNADDTAPKSTATGGMYEFVGNAVLKDYAVSGESYKLSADGTNFVKTSGAVYSPYEGLVFIPSASAAKAPLYLPVDQKPSGLDGLAADEMTVTCANGKIMVTSAEDTRVTVYHVSGTLVSQIDVAAGTTYTIDVPAGIYVVNKQKVVVY